MNIKTVTLIVIPTCGLDKSVKGVLGKYLVVDF